MENYNGGEKAITNVMMLMLRTKQMRQERLKKGDEGGTEKGYIWNTE